MVTVKSVLQYLPGAAFWKWGVQLGRSVPASDQTRMQRTSRGWVPFQTSKEHLCPQPSPTSLHPLHVPQSRTITLLPCVLPTAFEMFLPSLLNQQIQKHPHFEQLFLLPQSCCCVLHSLRTTGWNPFSFIFLLLSVFELLLQLCAIE